MKEKQLVAGEEFDNLQNTPKNRKSMAKRSSINNIIDEFVPSYAEDQLSKFRGSQRPGGPRAKLAHSGASSDDEGRGSGDESGSPVSGYQTPITENLYQQRQRKQRHGVSRVHTEDLRLDEYMPSAQDESYLLVEEMNMQNGTTEAATGDKIDNKSAAVAKKDAQQRKFLSKTKLLHVSEMRDFVHSSRVQALGGEVLAAWHRAGLNAFFPKGQCTEEDREDIRDNVRCVVADLVIAYENAINSENMTRMIRLWAPNQEVKIRVLQLPELAHYGGDVKRPSIMALSREQLSREKDAGDAKKAVEIAIDFYNGLDEKDSAVNARSAETGLIPLVHAYKKSLENLKTKGW